MPRVPEVAAVLVLARNRTGKWSLASGDVRACLPVGGAVEGEGRQRTRTWIHRDLSLRGVWIMRGVRGETRMRVGA
jgi:hypothetical protein